MLPRQTILAVLLAVSSASHAEELVDATNPKHLVEIIRDLGYRATLSTDDTGDPKIDTSVTGTNMTILFFGCVDNDDCKTLMFKVGYDLKDGTTLETVNAWNEKTLYGRAYLDKEQDPWLEMPLNLFGGVTRKNFEDTFDWWEVVVGEFEEHFGL